MTPNSNHNSGRLIILLFAVLLMATIFTVGGFNASAAGSTATPFPTANPNVGFSRQNPVPPNTRLSLRTTLTSDGTIIEWEMSISQVEFGPATTARIAKLNRFNKKPQPGQDYLVAYVQGRIFSITGKTHTFSVSSGEFGTVSDGKILTAPDTALISGPGPRLNFKGLAGAKFSGWIALFVFSGDSAPLITYDIQRDGINGIWFSAVSGISPTQAATETSATRPTQTAQVTSPTSIPTIPQTMAVALAIINAMPAHVGRFTLSRDPKLTYVGTVQGVVVGDRITYTISSGAQLVFAIWIGQELSYAVSRYTIELSRVTVPFIAVEIGTRGFVAPTNKGRDDNLAFDPAPWGVATFRNIAIDVYPTKTLSDEISITTDEAVQLLRMAMNAIPGYSGFF